MKRTVLLVILLTFLQISFAQEQIKPIEEAVFEVKDIDIEPNFPGGIDNFYSFFEKNFKKPEAPQLIGKLFVSFIVEKNGTISEIRTIKDVGFGTGVEAERVMQLSPRWHPGIKAGQKVNVLYTIAIPIQTK